MKEVLATFHLHSTVFGETNDKPFTLHEAGCPPEFFLFIQLFEKLPLL
jgi:hypothetical protein